MMFLTNFVLAVAVLGTASAQYFSLGNCIETHIEGIPNFDKTRVVGKWYMVKGSTIDEEEVKCFTSTMSLLEDSSFAIQGQMTYINQESGSKSVSFNATCQDKDHAGKFIWSPGFIADYQWFLVLDTDYENYLLSYSCLDAFKGKIESVFVDSRTKKLGDGILEKIEKVLKDKNIKALLDDHVQNCE